MFVVDYENRSRHGIVVAEFPHQKVRDVQRHFLPLIELLIRKRPGSIAGSLPVIAVVDHDCHPSWLLGRRVRYKMETQAAGADYRIDTSLDGVLRRAREYERGCSNSSPLAVWHARQSWSALTVT